RRRPGRRARRRARGRRRHGLLPHAGAGQGRPPTGPAGDRGGPAGGDGDHHRPGHRHRADRHGGPRHLHHRRPATAVHHPGPGRRGALHRLGGRRRHRPAGRAAAGRPLDPCPPGGAMIGVLDFIADHRAEVVQHTWEHIQIAAVSLLLTLAVALPLALWLAHTGRGGFLAINASNIGRALPSLAIIAVVFSLPGFGPRKNTVI